MCHSPQRINSQGCGQLQVHTYKHLTIGRMCGHHVAVVSQIHHSHNSSQFYRAQQEPLMFFRAFLMVSLNSVSSGSTQFSSVFKVELFFRPFLARHAFPLISRALALCDLAWMQAVFSSISPLTTQELFLPIE